MSKKRSKLKGQAAIEFLICILVIFFFLLLYMSLCVLLVTSDYMEYATFMAARTYKSAYGSVNDQEENARQVFNQYADYVSGIARNFKIVFGDLEEGNPTSGGVSTSWDLDLFYLPPLFLGNNPVPSRMTLGSETYLGREPNYQDCIGYFEKFVSDLNVPNMDKFVEEMDDNGC